MMFRVHVKLFPCLVIFLLFFLGGGDFEKQKGGFPQNIFSSVYQTTLIVGSPLSCVPAGVEAVLWAWCATETGPDERFRIIYNVVLSVIVAKITG